MRERGRKFVAMAVAGAALSWSGAGRRRKPLFCGLFLATSLVIAVSMPSGGAAQAKKKKVIRLETITVEGRIQKPQAFYILQRSNLNFDELDRAESFLPKIIKSVDKDPF